MRNFCLFAPILFLGATVCAQLPRKEIRVNSTSLRSRAVTRHMSVGQALVFSPRELAPASGPGLHPTAVLVYAIWVEKAQPGYLVKFTRSVDGGFTWGLPKTIFKQNGGGAWDFEQLAAGATYNQVFVVMSTGTSTGWPNEIYAMASADEGNTWTKPTIINTTTKGQGDADAIRMAVSERKAHVVYEYSVKNNTAPEDIYYVGLELKQGKLNVFKSETRVSTGTKPATNDVNDPRVAAFGPFVAVAWTDDRVGQTRNLYVAVSRAFGTDFGTSTAKETQITNYTSSNPRSDGWWTPDITIYPPNIYIVWGDCTAWPNNVAFSFSNDLGKTFSKPIIINKGGKAKSADADDPVVYAFKNRVLVAWHDDRDNPGKNQGNAAFVAVDNRGGKDFQSGNYKEVRLDAKPTGSGPVVRTERPLAAMLGDRIIVVYEKAKYNPNVGMDEDLSYVISDDGGKTWSQPIYGTKRGSMFNNTIDVDNPIINVTLNGDITIAWADNRRSSGDLFIGGLKFPLITYIGNNKGFKITHFDTSNVGDLAVILVTDAGTKPPLILDNMGFQLNFQIGSVTASLLLYDFFYSSVGTNLVADFPRIPNGLGIFHAIGLGINPITASFSWFTDPVLF